MIISMEKASINHSRANRSKSSQAPPTKSSWSTKGKGAPLFTPNLLFTKLPAMSPSMAPADKQKSAVKKEGKCPKECKKSC